MPLKRTERLACASLLPEVASLEATEDQLQAVVDADEKEVERTLDKRKKVVSATAPTVILRDTDTGIKKEYRVFVTLIIT